MECLDVRQVKKVPRTVNPKQLSEGPLNTMYSKELPNTLDDYLKSSGN